MESHALIRVLIAMVPASMLLCGAFFLFRGRKTLPSLLQLFGAACLEVVALAHVAEALPLLPWMDWGLERSAGHYLDLGSAVLGLTLFPVGYLIYALRPNR